MATATKRRTTKATKSRKATKRPSTKAARKEPDYVQEVRAILGPFAKHVNLRTESATDFDARQELKAACLDYIERIFEWWISPKSAARIAAVAGHEHEKHGYDLDDPQENEGALGIRYKDFITPEEYGVLLAYRAAADDDRRWLREMAATRVRTSKDAGEIAERVDNLYFGAQLSLKLKFPKEAEDAEGGCELCI